VPAPISRTSPWAPDNSVRRQSLRQAVSAPARLQSYTQAPRGPHMVSAEPNPFHGVSPPKDARKGTTRAQLSL
jgi:hypothetical protein